jgi:hypothetical protein
MDCQPEILLFKGKIQWDFGWTVVIAMNSDRFDNNSRIQDWRVSKKDNLFIRREEESIKKKMRFDWSGTGTRNSEFIFRRRNEIVKLKIERFVLPILKIGIVNVPRS